MATNPFSRLFSTTEPQTGSPRAVPELKRLLNVGGNSKGIELPPQFDGWEHLLLDIDPRGNPDLLCDARNLLTTPEDQYDAVYCSHNLEHYLAHDAVKVVLGFHHIIKPGGFALIRVPDMGEVMRRVVENGLDIEDELYVSPDGFSISVKDVMYGWGKEIEESGQDYYAHKTGFTEKSLLELLYRCGFSHVFSGKADLEICAFAFLRLPDAATCLALGLTPPD